MADVHKSYDSKFLDDPRFQSLLVSFLEALQRGEEIDPDAMTADVPDYRDEIQRLLSDRQMLEGVAAEFSDDKLEKTDLSAYEQTMDSRSAASGWSEGDTIRYIGEYEILEEIARGGMGIVFRLFGRICG